MLGAHQSIAGGYYKSVDIAAASTCECVQLFTKNNNQWKGKEISDDDVALFKKALKDKGIKHPLSHDSYLINLAAPVDELWEKSIAAMEDELRRAERLGIPYVVTHPGSYTTTDEATGLKRIIAALDRVHDKAPELQAVTLLECTAGQGTNLGNRFEHLETILGGVKEPKRLAVCLDTCHLFAAGYELADAKGYDATMKQLDKCVGHKLVKAFHLNDSKKGLGSRVDRHEHIGEGMIGLAGFRNLLNDPRFKKVPKYLETPKGAGGDEGIALDRKNLATLRALIA
ncbi:MAG: deoxyribonuclease IV [Pirellulales bacterium]